MKLPLSVLKSFIDVDASLAKTEDTLTTLGIEVDKVHGALPPFEGVVVAQVKSCRKHESSDKLQIAEVFDGKDLHQVVCAASNCRVGLRTAFAKVGAKLRDSHEKLHSIELTKIRGIESHGMLCSASELGIYEDNGGIIELPDSMPLGADCLQLLWDPVLEISLTPNLGHCMSALGIARELSAAWKKPLTLEKQVTSKHKNLPNVQIHVVNPTLCPRYMAQLIEHVKIGPSPFWLQAILQAAGHRPVNNVVDATNYILLKYGQPLHAFDYDKIEGHKIQIGPCHKEESFDALIGKTVILPPGTLVISDVNKTIAIAGVMGGANSSVSESTSTLLLEAASFDPIAIRIAARKTDLRSEGSQRFEKGVDSSTVADILEIATQLIVEIAGGTISTCPIDLKTNKADTKQIRFRPARANHILGTKISHNEMKDIFHRLNMLLIHETEQEFLLQIPSYRLDLTEEIDLVEEIARIYGYNHIERPLPKFTSPQLPHDPVYLFENDLRTKLIGLGLQEFLTCDLISPKLAAIAQETGQFLRTLHAKSEEYSVLRSCLLPGLLQVVKTNLDYKNNTFAAFEMGRIHVQQKGAPVEFPMAAIILTGKEAPNHWDQKPADADFFVLKGLVENLLAELRVKAHFLASNHPTFHPGRQADVFAGSLHIGTIGELHPNTLALLDIKQRVYYAELNAQHLQNSQSPSPKFGSIAQFPSSERDWTLPIQPQTHISTLFDAIRSVHSPLLERFELIGTYRAADKANVTIRFTYRDRNKTVSYEEAQAAHDHLQQEVLAKTNLPG